MPAAGKSGRPESLTVDSSSTVLRHPKQMKAEGLSDLDGNGRASRWPAIVSKVVGRGESDKGEMSKALERRNGSGGPSH
jgi:hypothetical protein